jgi:hypothetical protein
LKYWRVKRRTKQDCICEEILCHRINATLNITKRRFCFWFYTIEFCHNAVVSSEFGASGHISASQMKDNHLQMCLMLRYKGYSIIIGLRAHLKSFKMSIPTDRRLTNGNVWYWIMLYLILNLLGPCKPVVSLMWVNRLWSWLK